MHLHGGDEGDLVLRAPPIGAAGALAAEVGVIGTHIAAERACGLALVHRLHDLVLEQPGRAVRHPEVATQLQSRHVGLRLRDQIDRQEPGGQRQMAALHHRPHAQAALVLAALAQPVGLVTAPEGVGVDTATARAGKALWPAPLDESRLALGLSAVAGQECAQGQAGLHLDLIDCHGLGSGESVI